MDYIDLTKIVPNKLTNSHIDKFTEFLQELEKNNDDIFFHPHKFNDQSIQNIIYLSENGEDEYWLFCHRNNIVSYGLLRGWSEGYTIPSVGVAVSLFYRGRGVAKYTMNFLHNRAKIKKAAKVRLKVDKNNTNAIKLYESMGYVLNNYSDSELIGFLEI